MLEKWVAIKYLRSEDLAGPIAEQVKRAEGIEMEPAEEVLG